MKLKKGEVPTKCWDKETGSIIYVHEKGLVSKNFGLHKVAYHDNSFSWTITHLSTGLSLGLVFDSLKQARHAIALLESTPAPFPWSELNATNLEKSLENSEVVMEIRSKSYEA